MREVSGFGRSGGGVARTTSPDLGTWLSELGELEPQHFDEGSALAAITQLEVLKRAAAAAQARLSVRVDEVARQRQRDAGVRSDKLGAGIGSQIGLARMESPHRGARHLGLAKALSAELTQTLGALSRGQVSEWQATIVARETACVDVDLRRRIDHQIADRLPSWGEAQTEREVRRLVSAGDPGAVVKRQAQAEADRTVTIRPAPDTMCYLTALLPAVQGVAAYAALLRAADQARASGDARGKGQVLADTFVKRLTGQASAADVPVEIDLVMPAETLLGDGHTPAHLSGYGPLPAACARRLVRDSGAAVWVRRLFTAPDSRHLVAMESRRRLFEGQLRRFVILRDQFCRMPWCDAPIRHVDHPQPHRDDGGTDHVNAQGLCEACNHAKEAPGWAMQATYGPAGHLVTVTTPTDGRYESRAPDPPNTASSTAARSHGPPCVGLPSV